MVVETLFPRGPLKSAPSPGGQPIAKPQKKDQDLFSVQTAGGKSKAKTKKWKKSSKKGPEKDEAADGVRVKSLDNLSYSQLSEGLLVLCRVCEVRDADLRVSLPGRNVATVAMTSVSTPYTEALKALAKADDEDASEAVRERFYAGNFVDLMGAGLPPT